MEGLTKLKPECFTNINQAHMDMMMADGTTVMEFVANKVPCTIDVFTQMLDKSITIDERECGLVGKTLAFDRVFHFPGVSGNSLLPYQFVGNSHEFIRQTGIPAHPWVVMAVKVVISRA